jgi:hypothetical protein
VFIEARPQSYVCLPTRHPDHLRTLCPVEVLSYEGSAGGNRASDHARTDQDHDGQDRSEVATGEAGHRLIIRDNDYRGLALILHPNFNDG